jgi:hypothetical protein
LIPSKNKTGYDLFQGLRRVVETAKKFKSCGKELVFPPGTQNKILRRVKRT